LLPRLAVVDPELTLDLPPSLTASTGLDALTQLIEPFVSVRANSMTDLFCLEGVRRILRSLERAYEDGRNLDARTDMAFASLLGGLALANAGLGVVHGFAAPIGGMFSAPHGAVCAALLPHAMEANIRALRARAANSAAVRRYARLAEILTGRPEAAPEVGVARVHEICRKLEIPRLRQYGVAEEHVADLVGKAQRASSMKGNPLPLQPAELATILRAAI
jgi:alcohol dehydrogenase class IV